jgi:hypothetical protein
MIRWLIVVFLALVLINGLPLAAAHGAGAAAGRFPLSAVRARVVHSAGQQLLLLRRWCR